MTEVCDCGFEAKNATGLAAHQRACDEVTDDDSEDSYGTPPTVSTAVAESVFERDDESCERCESTDDLTIHCYDEDGADHAGNHVLLCADCDDFIEGGDPLTKRDQVRNGS